jgi:hypothetical protein
MARFTLCEREVEGDSMKAPAGTPLTEGDQLFIINRVLVDRRQRQRGTLVLRGTLVQVSQPPTLWCHSKATTTSSARV